LLARRVFNSSALFEARSTGSVLRAVLQFLLPGISGEAIAWAHFLIRKLAHVVEYFVFTWLLYRAFRQDRPDHHWRCVLLSELLLDLRGSVECWLRGFKVQFLHYPYRLLEELHKTKWGRLADPLDIALMKLTAISQRGSKRDFVDLACFLRSYPQFPLGELLELLPRKYDRINRAHYLRALVYFQEAKREPVPRMRWDLNWKQVKDQLEQEVTQLLR
jgi:hypothetical protein